ncbi:pyridoxal-phosphate-dependent aminotransferase family protein [Thermoflexus sp.]|uniref:pyridoxal-phosphate-dependent aminotransferase family protein n=1 Tax=Thermoflexus sp. TaxID=1969742 RepID=UPI0035E41433
MRTYLIPLVPGPTTVPAEIRAAYQEDYGSADLEPEYYELYAETQEMLRTILGTRNSVVMMTGEAMVALWGALKSTLRPGDRVVAVATGVFGYGIADMARSLGAAVEVVGFDYDEAADPQRVEEAIRRVRPKLVTMVHCETPSGTLNPVAEVGGLVAHYEVPLFYVDAVSSAAGVPLRVDEWHIDLCLVGTQKCLSALPDLGIVTVSERAWEIVREVGYVGYDALAPFRTALEDRWFPYTPSWHAMAALNVACRRVLQEGLENVFRRHAEVAAYCRERLKAMGIELFPRREEWCSPTVTAAKVPQSLSWPELDRRLRERGMVVGGSLGPLAGKVFRIGHMGAQADMALVRRGMDILEEALRG